MSRADDQRLEDIRVACEKIIDYVNRQNTADDLVFDAIRIRLVEIGKATKDVSAEVRALEPNIPWSELARMRDLLAHRYFDTTHAIVETTARRDIPELLAAIRRLSAR